MNPTYQSSNADFTLYQGDTLELLKEFTTKVDMIFADPPYFLSKGFTWRENGKVKCFDKGDWDRQRSTAEVDEFNMHWLGLCRNVLKDGGCIWVTGTYHNISSVERCLTTLGYKILNIIVWQKPNAPLTLSDAHFNFSAEYIIWARKSKSIPHYFNNEAMTALNSGKRMPDVWSIPTVETWEKHFGKHPTQKPLRLLYRAILSNTRPGETVFDPFTGSGTTGIAANLIGRNFIGMERENDFIQKCIARRQEIEDSAIRDRYLTKISIQEEEPMVIVNHARQSLRELMIEKGICYLRAGDSKGSLLVKPGFERLQYVLLHTNGEQPQMFKLLKKGQFQIWTADTLKQYGFQAEHAPYYVVLHFDPLKEFKISRDPHLKRSKSTYIASLCPLSEFVSLV
ncbi:MAG: site-specific DNA-methyltransferase [Bacteroidales bacterium]|nr:site-specific DNA-methyltransferase [Bacteroidales bacterium]